MPFAVRLLPQQYSEYVYFLELISEYFSLLETGIPLSTFDYFELSKQAKIGACKFGIKVTKRCNGVKTPIPNVLWSHDVGITKTTLHAVFDELSKDLLRFGQIRQYGTKTFENYVKELRQPTLKYGNFTDPMFYSKCTQIYGEDLSLTMAIEYNLYVLLYIYLLIST